MKKVLLVLSFMIFSSTFSFAQSFSATASWNATTTYTDGSTGTGFTYNLYRATSSTGTGEVKLNTSPITTTSYTDTTGTVNVLYFYRLSAVSSSGVEGAKTPYVQFTETVILVPSPPTNFTVQ